MTRILDHKLDDSYKFLVTENEFTNKILKLLSCDIFKKIELKDVENSIFGILFGDNVTEKCDVI